MYNERETFKKKIEAKMKEVENLCYNARLPMFAGFAVEDNGMQTDYKYFVVTPQMTQRKYSQDKISKFVKIGAQLPISAQGNSDDMIEMGDFEVPILEMNGFGKIEEI